MYNCTCTNTPVTNDDVTAGEAAQNADEATSSEESNPQHTTATVLASDDVPTRLVVGLQATRSVYT